MLKPQRILVVDDSEDARGLVTEALGKEGYSTASVDGAGAALQLLARHSADLVLVDYRMPGIDGIELIRQIREHTPDQRVLLMTAYGRRREAPGRGVARCIRKPIDVDDLCWMVEVALASAARVSASGAFHPGAS